MGGGGFWVGLERTYRERVELGRVVERDNGHVVLHVQADQGRKAAGSSTVDRQARAAAAAAAACAGGGGGQQAAEEEGEGRRQTTWTHHR